MDFAIILMALGIFFIIVSFFFRDRSKKVESELEDLSISIYQETNALKRRLKIVEEELLVEPNFQVTPPSQNQVMQSVQQAAATATGKTINGILVSQVIALNEQGLSTDEISKRSTLTSAQIQSILGGR